MKIGFVSLGCPKNLVDSEVMLGLVQRAGHTLTADAADADVIVVNTCAFIDSAKQESVDAILEMAAHKRNRAKRLIVTGCLGERYREQLQREMPEIDVVLGTNEVPDIVRAVEGHPGEPVPITLFRKRGTNHADESQDVQARESQYYLYDANTPRVLATPRHFAYLKIAEGCDYKCAFCIIPKLRGPYRSRPVGSLVQEACSLAARGVRELLLISQDTTFYGVDRGERSALARLLRELNRIDGLEWIRLLYLYPTTIDDRVLDAIGDCGKVCRYIDLPLQHASAPVLKRMKRPGTGATYARLLDRIRRRLPGVALRTTFIVGFPGESEAEFRELETFVREQAFDHVGVFTYSHEEGTTAYRLGDDVPGPVKTARQRLIMKTQRALVARRNRARIGQRVRLLVDGPGIEHELVLKARTEGQAPDIDSVVYLSDCDPSALASGTFVEAEIVGSRGYDLLARPFPPAP